jgi:hypothetical protein
MTVLIIELMILMTIILILIMMAMLIVTTLIKIDGTAHLPEKFLREAAPNQPSLFCWDEEKNWWYQLQDYTGRHTAERKQMHAWHVYMLLCAWALRLYGSAYM